MADNSELIVVALVCFGVGILTGVSLSFAFVYMTKMVESTSEPSSQRYLEVETDERGVIKQVVTSR